MTRPQLHCRFQQHIAQISGVKFVVYVLFLLSLADTERCLASTFSIALLASSVVGADSPASSAVGRHVSGLNKW